MSLTNLEVWFENQLPSIVQAVLILAIGLLVAYVLAALTRRLLTGLEVDQRLESGAQVSSFSVTRLAGQAVFWFITLFALVGALDALDLGVVAGPIRDLVGSILGFVPNLIAGGLLALVAWVLATLARKLVESLLRSSNAEERLARTAGLDQQMPIGSTLATVVYYLVWLLFLPGILSALELGGLLAPVQGLVDDLVGFLPNLVSAGIILGVGYLVARIVRDIVTNLLASTGVDALAARAGFGGGTPEAGAVTSESAQRTAPRLSGLLGTLVFALILIPVAITALDALQLEALSQPAIAMLNQVLEAIPAIFAAGILLAIAYFAGRLIADLISNILSGMGFDRILTRIGLRENTAGGRSPSDLVGMLVLVGIMLFAAAEAANLLGFEALGLLVTEFLVFLGNVVLGLIVLGLGLYLANLAAEAIRSSGVQNSDLLATVGRAAIILLASAMAVRQMGIADDIVTTAFTLLLGAVAVAAAIAFGLGGREIAGRELEKMVTSLRERDAAPQVPDIESDV